MNKNIKKYVQSKDSTILFFAFFLLVFFVYSVYLSLTYSIDILYISIPVGIFSFILFSPWTKLNFFIGGILILISGLWMLSLGVDTLILSLPSVFIGTEFLLRAFNKSLIKYVHVYIKKILNTEFFISIIENVKVGFYLLKWLIGIALILTLIVIFFSWIVGLGAMGIIIFLLILILLK